MKPHLRSQDPGHRTQDTGATTETLLLFRSGEALKLSQLLRNYTLELLNFSSPSIFHPSPAAPGGLSTCPGVSSHVLIPNPIPIAIPIPKLLPVTVTLL